MSSRAVVLETVYFGGIHEPITHECRFSVPSSSEEQAYQRRVTVKQELIPLDTGWVSGPMLLVLENPRLPQQTILSKEEKDKLEAQIILVYCELPGQVKTPLSYIPYGESIRIRPVKGVTYWLECQSGEAKVVIMAVPL